MKLTQQHLCETQYQSLQSLHCAALR